MIAWLSGRVRAKDPPWVTVDVRGVGYQVALPLTAFARIVAINESIELHIQTVVREDALLLYGFFDQEEKNMFCELVKISGVGAKVALSILSAMSVNELLDIAQNRSSTRLVAVPGIGKKTAERLVVELSNRFQRMSIGPQGVDGQVSVALQALGYAPAEADRMVRSVGDMKGADVGERVRLILRSQ